MFACVKASAILQNIVSLEPQISRRYSMYDDIRIKRGEAGAKPVIKLNISIKMLTYLHGEAYVNCHSRREHSGLEIMRGNKQSNIIVMPSAASMWRGREAGGLYRAYKRHPRWERRKSAKCKPPAEGRLAIVQASCWEATKAMPKRIECAPKAGVHRARRLRKRPGSFELLFTATPAAWLFRDLRRAA